MNTKNNIVQELSELNSQLAGVQASTPFVVPAGYFEGLVAQVLKRIKAEEAINAAEEIGHLSPLLAGLVKQNPYTVPAGYFDSIDETVSIITNKGAEPSVQKELEAISPLLSGLKKTNPYNVPAGYFEQIDNTSVTINKPAAKVVSMGSRNWWKMAAAAVVIGVIVIAGLQFFSAKENKDSLAKVEKEIKKASDTDLNEVLELTGDDTQTASADDAKELLKDIPESELKEFLQETSDIDIEAENAKLN